MGAAVGPQKLLAGIGKWILAGRCLRADPDELFVAGARQHEVVKSWCEGCPVRRTCLAVALDTRTEYGVWGGQTERERRKLLDRHQHIRNWHDALGASAEQPVIDAIDIDVPEAVSA